MQLLLAVLEEKLAARRVRLGNQPPPDRTGSWAEGLRVSKEDEDMLYLPTHRMAGYARVTVRTGQPGGPREHLLFHRIIMARKTGRALSQREHVDHINGDRLDNRRENLRLTDNTGNCKNRHKILAKSGYIGVHKKRNQWIAQLSARINGKRVSLLFRGYPTPEAAALAYNQAAEKHGFLTRNILPTQTA